MSNPPVKRVFIPPYDYALENFPAEIRDNNDNFICWNAKDEPGYFKLVKIPINPNSGKNAAVSIPKTWASFQLAKVTYLANQCSGVGIVLTAKLYLVCIDLDDPDEKLEDGTDKYPDKERVRRRQQLILKEFDSYTELSPSGKGYHIWVYGSIPSGKHGEGVEIYHTGHYMTITGWVVNSSPIRDYNDLVNQLWQEMNAAKPITSTNVSELSTPQSLEDQEILRIASSASNGLKFIELYEGRWQNLYPSQSEADQSMCNYLCYYTQNVEQIKRIFLASALGKTINRKAKPDNYLMNPKYGLIPKAFDKTLPTIDLDTLRNNLEEQLAASRSKGGPAPEGIIAYNNDKPELLTPATGIIMPYCGQQTSVQAPIQAQAPMTGNLAQFRAYLSLPPTENALCRANLEAVFTPIPAPVAALPVQPEISSPHTNPNMYIPESKPLAMQKSAYSVPPGIIGEMARFIYESSPRPVPEIAIAGAIGLMAGVCGRAYNVSATGLNQYIFLLALTGAGKDGLSSGIDKLIANAVKTVPAALEFIGPAEIASPQALTKYISKTSKSFVSLVGEFSIKLKQICSPNAHSNESGLKRAMLDLYTKSGHNKTLGKMIYSDKDKNTDVITGPAFSLLGEGTPEKFYEMLSKEMIEEGLLPRFLIMEYKGKRPKLNVGHNEVMPSNALSDYFASICAYALQLNNGNNVLNVQCDAQSQAMFDKYNEQCDHNINTGNEVSRQLWNRAHLKSLKLAALLAVGVNYINPIINVECAQWALDIVTTDIKNLLSRFDSGDVGATNVQNDQISEVKKAMKRYLEKDWSEIQNYPGVTLAVWNIKAIPHSYLSAICRTKTSFKNDRLGPIQAIKTVLGSMLESGDIVELSPMDKRQKGLGSAKVYMVTNLNSLK